MPNPGPQKHDVEIQGAKIISEGGYLWFHVVNHDSRTVAVEIHPPSDVMIIGKVPSTAYLGTNQSTDFYFQVLYYWSGSPAFVWQDSTKELRFVFEIYTQYRTTKMTDENIAFNVEAVPLNQRVDNWTLVYVGTFILAVLLAVFVFVMRLRQQEKRRKS